MASAWGKSWGAAFGAAWGALLAQPAPVQSNPLGGSTIRRSGGRRRILPYIEPIPDPLENSLAIKNIAINETPSSTKRSRAQRELELLLLLH